MTTTTKTKTQEIIEGLVDKIVTTMGNGNTGRWQKPWTQVLGSQSMPVNATTHNQYKGFNVLVLWAVGADAGYAHQLWATYKQWQSVGGQVRKGEAGTQLVKWGVTYRCDGEGHKPHKGARHCPDPDHRNERHMWASTFTVFNAAQQDGFEVPEVELPETTVERLAHAEEFVAALGADIREQPSNEAYYHTRNDFIIVPALAQFETQQGFYGTLFHELTHWTSHKSRLDRKTGAMFGDGAYASEELVAELGATYLASHFGIEVEPHVQHALYLEGWLKALKDDPMVLYRAARDASAAAEYLLGNAQGTQPTDGEEEK